MTPCGWQADFPPYPANAQTTLSSVKLYQSLRVIAFVLHNSSVTEMFCIYRPIIVTQTYKIFMFLGLNSILIINILKFFGIKGHFTLKIDNIFLTVIFMMDSFILINHKHPDYFISSSPSWVNESSHKKLKQCYKIKISDYDMSKFQSLRFTNIKILLYLYFLLADG
jgi:hypothetical protein